VTSERVATRNHVRNRASSRVSCEKKAIGRKPWRTLRTGKNPAPKSRLPPPVPRSSHALDAALTRRVMDSDSRTATVRCQRRDRPLARRVLLQVPRQLLTRAMTTERRRAEGRDREGGGGHGVPGRAQRARAIHLARPVAAHGGHIGCLRVAPCGHAPSRVRALSNRGCNHAYVAVAPTAEGE
jgi:hypothetical protein